MKTFADPEAFARVRRVPPHARELIEPVRELARARGPGSVDLAGTPQLAPPAPVLEAVHAVAAESRAHRSLDPRGTSELRAAAAAWLLRRKGIEVDPEREVVATQGSEETIGRVLQLALQEGDGVLTPTPTWPSHAHAPVLCGGESIPVPCGPGIDFMSSLVVATERAERRPRALLVSFPAHPTAAVATPALFQELLRFAEARDLFILSDAASCDLVYDGAPAPLMLQLPGAKERTVELFSLGQSHGMASYGFGLAAGNPGFLGALTRVRSYLGGAPIAAAQAGAVVALEACDAAADEACALFRRRRDALVRWFGAAGWQVPAPAATSYAWAPIPEPLRWLGSLELCRRLAVEAGVALAPGVAFGPEGEGHVRIALSEDEPELPARRGAGGRLAGARGGRAAAGPRRPRARRRARLLKRDRCREERIESPSPRPPLPAGAA